VKPGNVLLTHDGRVKLVDFGLAILRERDSEATRSTAVAGTIAYMSPEQASGAEIGPPSDIFSFGVMAYELLTGQRPFEAERALSLLNKIVHEPHTPLSSRRPTLAGALVDVVDRCLRKEPAARFRDGAQLAQELQR